MARPQGTPSFGLFLFVILVALTVCPNPALAQCGAPANAIVAENCLPGNPPSDWDVTGAGDPTIQGFATDISVNAGQTVYFKINTNASSYIIEIYRIGYYGGLGARKIATISPSAKLPQSQPACLTDASTRLYDCGNWAVSASWQVPANATSGVYFAHLVRSDTSGDSHIVFIVRNDASHSAMLFQTADETWQAYNSYGGNSLYGGADTFDLPNRAFKVSYNRPFITRGFADESASWVFGAEYPMIRFLEANGYDVTYFTGVDAARNGALIQNHKVFLSVGHDEYWSGPHRANVEAARNAGVNLAFFSGNEVFWKTRWENSIDGTNTSYRTLVCYKQTLNDATDPQSPPTWTGTWRDPRFSPPSDGGRPENALTGTIFMVNGPGVDNDGSLRIQVPSADGKMRFWRNTAAATLASGATLTLPVGTLGYEWDEDLDNGARPAGAFRLSNSTYNLTIDHLLDYGAVYGAGTATHHLMMYRAPSGALVFGAGTIQWAWGLDANHDNPFGFSNPAPDPNMQQATVNLFADMGVQPATLQTGLIAATKSTDTVAPTSTIASPAAGSTVNAGSQITITGTASDSGGGTVAGVEVSTDGGQTWHPATGRSNWTYSWSPTALGTATIRSRAVDDSGNLESSAAGFSVTVAANDCPCEGWSPSTTPTLIDSGDGGAIEVGVKFSTDYAGFITGLRFYKAAANTGTHVGNIWSSSGTLLGRATFTNETASGWQQVTFATPVQVSANTTYVASYFAPVGHYAADSAYFATTGAGVPPVHLLAAGISGPNGVYAYSSSTTFPTSSYNSTNYWVDVVFTPSGTMPGAPPAILALPTAASFTAVVGQAAPPAQTISIYDEGSGVLPWAAAPSASWIQLSASSGNTPSSLSISVNPAGLTAGTYNGTVTVSSTAATNGPQIISVSLTVVNVLLSSTFDNGTFDGWSPSPLGLASNWSVVNQALQYNGGGPTQVFAGNSAWANYTVQTAVKLATLNDYPGGIRGRVNPSTGAAYTVWLYPKEGLIRLYRTVAWSIDAGFTQLGQAAVTFDAQNFHTVAASFQGSQIQVLYDGAVVITATDSNNASGMVALDVSNQVIAFDNVLVTSSTAPASALLTASPASLTLSAPYQGPNPAAQTVQVGVNGTGTVAWTAVSTVPWLSVSTTGGTTPASPQISTNVAGLNPGSYSGTVRVTSLGTTDSGVVTVNASLTVVAPPPALALSPGTLSFTALLNQPSPSPVPLAVSNSSAWGTFSWTGTSDSTWLTVSPASGSVPASPSVSVNANGLAIGKYTGNITVTAAGVANSPQTVPVSLNVLAQDLNETFSGQGAGWIISPMGLGGGWSTSNGVYSFNGSGLSQSCAGNAGWTDYTFDTNIQLSTLSNWPGGVRGRVNPSTGAGYAVWLYPGSGLAILYKVGQWNINGATLVVLGQSLLAYDTTKTHDLQMAFQGSQITVSWDGTTIISATDTSYTAGFVCLDADSQPISYSNVRVASTVSAVTLAVAPTSVNFAAATGAAPAPQTVTVQAGGASTTWAVSSSASWLTATASSTLTPGTITLTANPAGLVEGVYNATVTISAPGASNAPVVLPVTFSVKTALLGVNPTTLNFFGAITENPLTQQIAISNLGTGALNWTAVSDSAWLTVNVSSGAGPASIGVTAASQSLSSGQYSGNLTVSSADASNGPVTVPVSLQVGTVLFADNFSSGTASNWTVSPLGFASGWSVANGLYSYNGGGHTQSWTGNPAWTDYTVAADFLLASLNNYPGGLRGRLNTTTGAGYGVWIYPAQGVLKLYRIGQWNIDAGFALLAQSATLPMDATRLHNLRLVFRGSAIQVYYDNALAVQATDSTYSQGAVALDVSNQPISFTNVKVIGF